MMMSSLECMVLCIVINFLVLWSICMGSSLVLLNPHKLDIPGVYSFDEIPTAELGYQKLSRSSEIRVFYSFFHLHLVDGVRLQYPQVLVLFLFSERPASFFI